MNSACKSKREGADGRAKLKMKKKTVCVLYSILKKDMVYSIVSVKTRKHYKEQTDEKSIVKAQW